MIYIREIDLPMTVRGFTSPDPDGNYNIYINRDLSVERKSKTLEHEILHIKNNHCYSEEDVVVMEEHVNYG